ncbi:MAG TPA: DUF1801 domain-containing protein [Trueperaceae bacterium]
MTPSERITERIESLDDWRGPALAWLRRCILEADPELVEEWKWNAPVWSKAGLVCSVGTFKNHLKVNFFHGASLDDPRGLFNASLDAKVTRAIDMREGDTVEKAAFCELVRAAVAFNAAR